jgi:hypothetical protein
MSKHLTRIGAALLIAATNFGAASAFAAMPSRVADLQASSRPAGVPLDYVVTPNGFFHASCVIELADDDVVAPNGDIVFADGRTRKGTACAFPSFGSDGHARAASFAADGQSVEPTINGWVVDSNSSSTPASSKMVADFVVPSGPVSSAGQVLYFFPGLEAVPNVQSILQPVLAWNGFGDNAWSVTNWNCCISGTTYHGGTIAAATGDKVHSIMTGASCASNGICPTWKIVATNKRSGQKTSFKTDAHGQAFNWYFGGVMEVYGVNTCSQYPSNGSISFSNIHVYDLGGTESTPSNWNKSVGNPSPSCSYGLTTTKSTAVITFNAHG